MEKQILENQIIIMEALKYLVTSDSVKRELESQIESTEFILKITR